MQKSVIDLRQFMELGEGEQYYKGYFIPGHPGWIRVMVSKKRADGLVEAQNMRVFLDSAGHVLWHKPGLPKVQAVGDFERDLRDFKGMVEGAGLLMFIQDYHADGKEKTSPDRPR
jgi:hypothetical protein